jgi:uncharacterized protein (TIGR02147 family)
MKNEESHITFQHYIRKAFIERKSKNPSYSVRAYARFLGFDQSLLSKVLNGRKKLSLKSMETAFLKLGLSPMEIKKLISGKAPSAFEQMEEDVFKTISLWQHFALLEYMKTNRSKDVSKIASSFGLHKEEIIEALERMERLGFIKQSKNKWKTLKPNNSWANFECSSEARKNLQRVFLQKALQSLENDPFETREHGSLTVAINASKISEFKQKLHGIINDLSDDLQPAITNEKLTDVYQLNISFYPLTKNKEVGQ